jgi:hypothetical protein
VHTVHCDFFSLCRYEKDVACLRVEHRDLNILVDNVSRDKVRQSLLNFNGMLVSIVEINHSLEISLV